MKIRGQHFERLPHWGQGLKVDTFFCQFVQSATICLHIYIYIYLLEIGLSFAKHRPVDICLYHIIIIVSLSHHTSQMGPEKKTAFLNMAKFDEVPCSNRILCAMVLLPNGTPWIFRESTLQRHSQTKKSTVNPTETNLQSLYTKLV